MPFLGDLRGDGVALGSFSHHSMTKTALVSNNAVFTIANILSPAECFEYIALSENIGYVEALITTRKGFEIRPDIRNNNRLILDDPNIALNLWQRVSGYLPSKIGTWQAVGLNERFRFYRYNPSS